MLRPSKERNKLRTADLRAQGCQRQVALTRLGSCQHIPPLISPIFPSFTTRTTMLDPLSSTFGEEPPPPWPTTPRTPNTPIPNMPRPSTPRITSRPQTPDKGNSNSNAGGLYGRQPQIYGQPEPGLVSPTVTTGSNGHKYEKGEPYLRVRITGLDRNRRDVLVKFDAQVRISAFSTAISH